MIYQLTLKRKSTLSAITTILMLKKKYR